jgi:HK97 family phage major capsid protein
MSVAKDLRAKRAKLVNDARALIALPDLTAEQEGQFDTMMAEADRLMGVIEKAERADAVASDLSQERDLVRDVTGKSQQQQADESDREKRLLKAWMLRDFQGLTDADRVEMQRRTKADPNFQGAGSVGTNTAGGYTVAPDFMRELLIAQKAFGGMRAVARVIPTMTGVDLPWPTMDDTSNVATIVGENTSGAAGTDLAFGSKTLKAWTYRSGFLTISIELMQDSAFDFDTLIRDALALRFARGQNAHFTTGNGTTQPEGILTGGVVGKTGTTGQTTSVIYDDLIDLVHAIDPAYRTPDCAWMMNDLSIRNLRKLKDTTGEPLWQDIDNTAMVSGVPGRLLGYPVVVNQDFPVMAANAKSIAFGQWRNYMVRDVMALRIQRLDERFAENGQVGFVAFQRTDGRLVSAGQPIKWYANSAT